jgi:hypothetical protein
MLSNQKTEKRPRVLGLLCYDLGTGALSKENSSGDSGGRCDAATATEDSGSNGGRIVMWRRRRLKIAAATAADFLFCVCFLGLCVEHDGGNDLAAAVVRFWFWGGGDGG